MEDLVREKTDKTPRILLSSTGKIEISGISLPEDAANFYFEIIDWISDYYRTPCPATHVTLALTYVNSTSASMIFKIFDGLNRLQETDKTKITVDWYYEKEDIDQLDFINYIQQNCPNVHFDIKAEDSLDKYL